MWISRNARLLNAYLCVGCSCNCCSAGTISSARTCPSQSLRSPHVSILSTRTSIFGKSQSHLRKIRWTRGYTIDLLAITCWTESACCREGGINYWADGRSGRFLVTTLRNPFDISGEYVGLNTQHSALSHFNWIWGSQDNVPHTPSSLGSLRTVDITREHPISSHILHHKP